ncbi:MAG: hypothetical protein NT051_01685 [Candidatus Micrarchaeota archaeon]|nr:hypothetical protein [Candidatus Micrarchaeota archaeon]
MAGDGMAVERNTLVLAGTGNNPKLVDNKKAIAKFMSTLKLASYSEINGKTKTRIAVVDAVYVEKHDLNSDSRIVGCHSVLYQPTASEVAIASNKNPVRGYISATGDYVGAVLGGPEIGQESEGPILRLYGEMHTMALYKFARAAVLDFARHDGMAGIKDINTVILSGNNTVHPSFDSIAYADRNGNRVYLFNLVLTPLEGTNTGNGLLVVSNAPLGKPDVVDSAAKMLQEIFRGAVGIWQSNQPVKG